MDPEIPVEPFDSEERYRSRLFSRGAFFLGPSPEFTRRQWRILGLLVMASFFNAYDGTIFSLALKQIQAGLGIDEAQLGTLGGIIRMGILPGFLIVLLADSLGRRRILLWTIIGYTVVAGATAFAPDETSFVVLQFLGRVFMSAEMILAMVVIAEEIDADRRGWALGVLTGLSTLGGGLALGLFAAVDALPMGWRTLYLVGIVPLALIAYLRRNLPETRHFESYRGGPPGSGAASATLRPLISLFRMYPGRLAAVGSVIFLMSLSGQSAGFFNAKYLQDVHGWEPWRFALLGAVVGLAGICAMPYFGRLGDRLGRKPVTVVFIVLNPLSVVLYYHVGSFVLLPLLWLGMNLTDVGSDTNLRAFGQELFPTSYRSTAAGAVGIIGQLGGSLGLALESVLFGALGSHSSAVGALALVGLAVPFIVAFSYPETGSRPLEEISPER